MTSGNNWYMSMIVGCERNIVRLTLDHAQVEWYSGHLLSYLLSYYFCLPPPNTLMPNDRKTTASLLPGPGLWHIQCLKDHPSPQPSARAADVAGLCPRSSPAPEAAHGHCSCCSRRVRLPSGVCRRDLPAIWWSQLWPGLGQRLVACNQSAQWLLMSYYVHSVPFITHPQPSLCCPLYLPW